MHRTCPSTGPSWAMMTGLPCMVSDGPLAPARFSFHSPENGKLKLLTADVHVEDMVDGRVFVTDREGVDPALGAEDPHQPELTDVPEWDKA